MNNILNIIPMQTAGLILVILFALLAAGMGFAIHYLVKRLQELKKPMTKTTITAKELNKIVDFLQPMSFEHKLYLLHLIFGKSNVLIQTSRDGFTFRGVGKLVEDDEEIREGNDYVG